MPLSAAPCGNQATHLPRRDLCLIWCCAVLCRAMLQVRSGPLDLPLYKKPVDLTLRRTRRLTSRAFDLHLTLRGIE